MKPLIAAFALVLLGAAAAGVVAHAGARTTAVKVTEKEFHITLSSTKVAPGKVQLVVKNSGTLSHAIAISGPGLATKKTPLIRPGKTATLTVTLRSGKYTIWCPVPGHAAQGMKATLTSGSAGGASGSGSTTPTTTSSGSGGGGGEAWG